MAISVPLQTIWVRTAHSAIATDVLIRDAITTELTNQGWTLVSGTRFKSPAGPNGRQMELEVVVDVAFRIGIEMFNHVGASVLQKTFIVTNPQDFVTYTSAAGIFLACVTTSTTSFYYAVNLDTTGMFSIAESMLHSSPLNAVGGVDGGGSKFQYLMIDNAAAARFTNMQGRFGNTSPGALFSYDYADGTRRYVVAEVGQEVAAFQLKRHAGVIPGAWMVAATLADNATLAPSLEPGVPGVARVWIHTGIGGTRRMKLALRTA